MSHAVTRRTVLSAVACCVAASAVFAQERPGSAQQAASNSAGKTVVVFAAASLKTALDAIGTAWTAASGIKVTFAYAGSGALVKQIENGAPADVFVSADLKWMDYAQQRKLVQPTSRRSLIGNALVLVAPREAVVDLKIGKDFPLAAAIGDGKLAMGDPRSVPAGGYGQAALTSLGVWDAVRPKIAGAESVRAALAFVARGEARFGIVYRSDAASEPKVKIVDTFPANSHPPIVYPAALTSSSDNPAAIAVLNFLASPVAARIFAAEGFSAGSP